MSNLIFYKTPLNDLKMIKHQPSKDERGFLSRLFCQKTLNHLMGEKKISQIKTVEGPGPFTALRAGKAFAHGLAVGYGAQLFCPSFFDVFPRQIGQQMAIHTGIPRWIIENGHAIDVLSPEHIVVSSDSFSKQATLDLAQRLACYKG